MKPYESSIQDNNNKIKIKIKVKKQDIMRHFRWERERVGERIFFKKIILLFVSFSDLRKSDHRFSSRLKTKLIYATRARGY